ncbi:SixA phosphatase family protein [Chryseotalea sanaruensis]|nr:histidine phosphatase family protein [Chryseotalea sanaruensis]
MQRSLYIMRHAQAEEIHGGLHDKDRELTGKGQQEALIIGTQLSKQGFTPEYIYTSVANRTKHTAALVSDVLKVTSEHVIEEEELYNSSIRSYLSFINKIDASIRSVLLVGHNPTVSYLAEYLSNAEIGSMPTGGLCLLQITVPSWKEVSKESATLLDFIYPEQFSRS